MWLVACCGKLRWACKTWRGSVSGFSFCSEPSSEVGRTCFSCLSNFGSGTKRMGFCPVLPWDGQLNWSLVVFLHLKWRIDFWSGPAWALGNLRTFLFRNLHRYFGCTSLWIEWFCFWWTKAVCLCDWNRQEIVLDWQPKSNPFGRCWGWSPVSHLCRPSLFASCCSSGMLMKQVSRWSN